MPSRVDIDYFNFDPPLDDVISSDECTMACENEMDYDSEPSRSIPFANVLLGSDVTFSNLSLPFGCETDLVENWTQPEYKSDCFKASVIPNIIGKNCFFSGCGVYCKMSHDQELILDDNKLCTCILTDVAASMQTIVGRKNYPYTPTNDHCYSQPKQCNPTNEESDIDMDSSVSGSDSDTSDLYPDMQIFIRPFKDDVDVVTVSDENECPVQQKCLPRKRNRRTTQPQKLNRNKTVKKPTKANLKVLVKSKLKQKKLQTGRTTKRPSNSIESSPCSSLAGSSRSNSDADESEKRQTHNHLEKKRRNVQTHRLEDLRVIIPELLQKPKASKVLILNSAVRSVKAIEHEDMELNKLKEVERKRKRFLQKVLIRMVKRMKLKLC